MRRIVILSAAAIAAGFLVACEPAPSRSAPPAPTSSPNAAEQAAFRDFVVGQKSPPGTMPPGHPPAGRPAQPRPGDLPAGHPPVGATAGDLNFTAPEDWKPIPPTSSMRKLQFALPKAEGDNEDGELIVFYFGRGEGGPVRDNIERWKGQFTTAEGKPLPDDAAKEEKFNADEMKVTLLDVAGRYAPGAMPGMAATSPRDGYRMFAAVIESPGGAWFVKATGPAATMASHEQRVRAFLLSAKK